MIFSQAFHVQSSAREEPPSACPGRGLRPSVSSQSQPPRDQPTIRRVRCLYHPALPLLSSSLLLFLLSAIASTSQCTSFPFNSFYLTPAHVGRQTCSPHIVAGKGEGDPLFYRTYFKLCAQMPGFYLGLHESCVFVLCVGSV